MKRDNFSEKEMIQIADAIDCDLEISLKSINNISLDIREKAKQIIDQLP